MRESARPVLLQHMPPFMPLEHGAESSQARQGASGPFYLESYEKGTIPATIG